MKDETALAKFINDHVAFKAAEDSRRLTLPQKPEDYKLELPKDFKAPEGIEFVPNDKDPLLPQARAFAQKHGLSQEAFGELMALHAAGQIGSQQTIAAAKAAEIAKLGATGTARVTAAQTWMAAIDPDLGKHFGSFLLTEKQILFVEKLMARDRTQGQGNFNGAHREPPHEPGKVTEDQWKGMSHAARLDYARQFPQTQFQPVNGVQR